jgi:hypothetical protein
MESQRLCIKNNLNGNVLVWYEYLYFGKEKVIENYPQLLSSWPCFPCYFCTVGLLSPKFQLCERCSGPQFCAHSFISVSSVKCPGRGGYSARRYSPLKRLGYASKNSNTSSIGGSFGPSQAEYSSADAADARTLRKNPTKASASSAPVVDAVRILLSAGSAPRC